MSKKKKIMLIGIVVIFVVIGVGAVQVMKNKKDKGMVVKTVEVKRQDITSHIQTSGEVVSMKEWDVVADVAGKVEEILVEEGDLVKADEVLVSLERAEMDYQMKEVEIKLAMEEERLKELEDGEGAILETTLANAKLLYEDALAAYEQNKELYKAGVVSKRELDKGKVELNRLHNEYLLAQKNLENGENEAQMRAQEKQIELSKLAVEKLGKDLEKYTIKSPIEGTVVDVPVLDGGMVSLGSPILRIEDTNQLEVIINISEYDVQRVKIGDTVKITGDAFEGKNYEGKVKYIGPRAKKITTGQEEERVVEAKIQVMNGNESLLPGFSAEVDILTEDKKNVLTLPYEAIFTKKNGEKIVYGVEDGKARAFRIETGIESDLVVEVLSMDLKEKDLIILNPTESLEDGDEVQVNKGKDYDKNTKSSKNL